MISIFNNRAIMCAALLALCGCEPSSLFEPKDVIGERASSNTSGLAGGTNFPSGVWVDQDNTIWSISIDGNKLRAHAECGPNRGLKLTGKVKKDFISYTIDRGERSGIDEGRAMLVDDLHAYFIVSGQMQSHGLFHFNHIDVETECSAKLSNRGPIDLLPPSNDKQSGD